MIIFLYSYIKNKYKYKKNKCKKNIYKQKKIKVLEEDNKCSFSRNII
tara:strand:- start:2041 stop:2181 length:141 start_codon:yes stop_codon:yes gene_type:complete